MNDYTVARKYASSLFSDAKDNCLDLENIRKELKAIDGLLTPYVLNFLSHPVISLQEKIQNMQTLVSVKLSGIMINFISLLIEGKRLGLFRYIVSIYDDLFLKDQNKKKITVETPFELTETQKNRLESALKEKFKSDIIIVFNIRPDLIGGVVIKADDNVWDNSLRTKLQQLKTVF